ncbi:uncharacterized protein EMH_0011000 [Eimeria mitis]|uniref:Uncharacterized protein n=1 Tax=Eimeria mitis TaxID=44415 RepID=U6K4U2_9EIME|nr:uncharacterized protein EMH_0011000 [Eimeria mitis]CDJ31986.1 hypothetical protein, conserved [Eimeria mitis]
MPGRESDTINGKPTPEQAAASERHKLSAPSGDFWDSGKSVSNNGSCGISASEAFERAAAAIKSPSADPSSITGSMAPDSALQEGCSVAIHISCCPQRPIGGNSRGRSSLHDDGSADAGSGVSGSRSQERFTMNEREVEAADSVAGMKDPQSRRICISRQCSGVCPAQGAKVRCFSSPGFLAPASPALAQLAHYSQAEATVSPFCQLSRPEDTTPATGPREVKIGANECQPVSRANEQCNHTCDPFTEGSSRAIQDESNVGRAGGYSGAVSCARNQEEAVSPGKSANSHSCFSSNRQEGLQTGHKASKNDPMMQKPNNGTLISVVSNERSPQPPNTSFQNTSKEGGCADESAESAANSVDTFCQQKDSRGASISLKLREQREWKSVQEVRHNSGDFLQPRHGASANAATMGVTVEKFLAEEGRSPRSVKQGPFNTTLGSAAGGPSSPGFAVSSPTSFELLERLHENIRTAKTSAVVTADNLSYPSNPIRTEAQTSTEDSNAFPSVPRNHVKKTSELDRNCLVKPSTSGFPQPSVFSVSSQHSPCLCHSLRTCIHTVQCVVPGGAQVPMRGPQIHSYFYPLGEKKFPLQPNFSHAYKAPNKTYNNSESLADFALMDDLKVACPSSPPTTEIPSPLIQRRTADNPTLPLMTRSNEDANMIITNELTHQAESNDPYARDRGEASTCAASELRKRQAANPHDSKVPSCASAGKSPQLHAYSSIQDREDHQSGATNQGHVNTHKIAGEQREERHPGAEQAERSAAFLYFSTPGNSDSKSTRCTSAGRSRASRFLGHVLQGMRLTRLRHRSTSAPRIPFTSLLHKTSADSGGANCEEGKAMPQLPGCCVRITAQTAKKTLAVDEPPADFNTLTRVSREIRGGKAGPNMKIGSSPRPNFAEVEHSTAGREQTSAATQRCAVQTAATFQGPQTLDTAKGTLRVGAPVFSVSASHSCFPPSDMCSNSHSEDRISLPGHFEESSGGILPSKRWSTHNEAASPSFFRRHEEVIDGALRTTANPGCMPDDSDGLNEATDALGTEDRYLFTARKSPIRQDLHANGCLDTATATACPLTVAAGKQKTEGGSQNHLSERLLRNAELQKWQHLLQLNNILQQGRR